ncbi:bifunctional tRNA (5-methylaminomethyl-2-thiouridine)(34)-methyltransferase MnmD/FAD-dependent 5-carboxymethylaminomethyl-2-thiouridine(34) oxidoreductase MnmC [Marinobacter orientalis]|uniref:tRNA 5-methylaminomethyl-2-thiouridine biosynthesis bifunctional protein MnmC n=1 Tax=Marinobacter orientalis TaxID=1928859 RepID=A0A7Y0REL0_9GAMM|nr:bifunctional tRNA (5-methylaminomethyl-2-thiouridine)(34)-methyltransferase MnmD/FAD-dependent 5-carboxymethylaminomethyl-2-thiouridine(34) oxidoreductase MnmC [Marinobacter orientalis]NMT64830.1 bifunctional tRNA (5-methylaminomethyl-2-thiouridine)(34)-methyltransferase MnmD/FAD-dependent 5-carboxymethylaminomethyl-2-thiouridine(34) oxidoreductase MnmC [Marinobacter orientalis]TGX48820.1 bifunctional tRNA (5-methylaminomethyl-2-thiouridine)(34)-methyltransferase MnmD/FAD-dependent 5-carboxyme
MSTDISPPSIETAAIEWREGVPCSTRFDDVYFSRDDGLEEARHVFIRHNRLAERFARVPAGGSFAIAETGFGTGLNFLAAWQTWEASGPADNACLHFISAERYPLDREDLRQALSLWPELGDYAAQLLDQYPPPVQGAHRLVLAAGRIRLTLFFGDVLEAWRELDFHADAWFLDGFAPAKNPDMWEQAAITALRRHSRPGTTMATFTAVGEVRRLLTNAGFTMRKTPGFGRKLEMMAGELPRVPEAGGHESPTAPHSIAIIGAGVAGSLLARNLAQRGVEVTLIDRAADAGMAASGNCQGALYVKLGVEFNDQAKLGLSSLLFSQRYYAQSGDHCWHPTGLIQLAYSDTEAVRQARFIARNDYPQAVLRPIDATEASRLAGIPVNSDGLWFPLSGWLEPGRLCRSLVRHSRIRHCFGFDVHRLTPCNGRWHIAGNGEQDVVADRVVICAGHLTPELIPLRSEFRFRTIRGQVSHLPEPSLNNPAVVLCGPGYINPAHKGTALTGATFDLHDHSPALSVESHRENLSMLASMVPSVFSGPAMQLDPALLEGKVAFRCTTHDYQPVAGPLTDPAGRTLEGIDLFTGLGSKGLTYAPLLAEYLADRITGQPQCLPASLARRVATQRCHRRDASASETIGA